MCNLNLYHLECQLTRNEYGNKHILVYAESLEEAMRIGLEGGHPVDPNKAWHHQIVMQPGIVDVEYHLE